MDQEFPPEDASVDATGKFERFSTKPELWLPARCAGSPSEACLFDQIRPNDATWAIFGLMLKLSGSVVTTEWFSRLCH